MRAVCTVVDCRFDGNTVRNVLHGRAMALCECATVSDGRLYMLQQGISLQDEVVDDLGPWCVRTTLRRLRPDARARRPWPSLGALTHRGDVMARTRIESDQEHLNTKKIVPQINLFPSLR
jgi:hypothetical protein